MNSCVVIFFLLTLVAFGTKIVTPDLSKPSNPSNPSYPQFPNINGIGILSAPGLLKKCGDGELFFVSEECDDGNLIDGDGCSSCRVDKGWSCSKEYNQKSFCKNLCGNGVLDSDSGQQCQYTLPGRLCTLKCVIDQSKKETCMNKQNFFLQSGEVCDSYYGCYNCLYINELFECENVETQQGKFTSTCGLKCNQRSNQPYDLSFQNWRWVIFKFKLLLKQEHNNQVSTCQELLQVLISYLQTTSLILPILWIWV